MQLHEPLFLVSKTDVSPTWFWTPAAMKTWRGNLPLVKVYGKLGMHQSETVNNLSPALYGTKAGVHTKAYRSIALIRSLACLLARYFFGPNVDCTSGSPSCVFSSQANSTHPSRVLSTATARTPTSYSSCNLRFWRYQSDCSRSWSLILSRVVYVKLKLKPGKWQVLITIYVKVASVPTFK